MIETVGERARGGGPGAASGRAPGVGPGPSGRPGASRRRVAFVMENFRGGGVQRMTVVLARALAERGVEVDLFVLDPHGVYEGAIAPGVRVHGLAPVPAALGRLAALRADPGAFLQLARPVLLARRTWRQFEKLPALARLVRQRRPDALIAAGPALNLAAVWATRSAPRPRPVVVVTERTAPSAAYREDPVWRKRYLPALVRRTYAQADAIVAVSAGLADDLAAYSGLARERIDVIYNPAVSAGLPELARAPLVDPWFAPGEPPVVLATGRLADQKDFPTLIRAFARVRRDRPARLVILGQAQDPAKDPGRRSELRALAAGLGVADDVRLPGFQRNPFAWMARAGVFVLSSRYEGFGNALAEAMACGCPVVSTDCPSGPREIVGDDGRHGRLVPVGDDAAMGAAIAATLDAPTPPERLRERAALFAEARSADAYLTLLDRLWRPRGGEAGARPAAEPVAEGA